MRPRAHTQTTSGPERDDVKKSFDVGYTGSMWNLVFSDISLITAWPLQMTAVDCKSIASPLDKTWTSSHSLEYQHPLDPLSPAEIARAVSLIKSQCAKEISDSHTFTSVCLLEPPRETLWNYEHLLLPHERVHALHKMDRRAIGCDVCLLVLPFSPAAWADADT
jgi:hypothetical protein